MKINRKEIYTFLNGGDNYTLSELSKADYRALQTWAKNEGLKISRYGHAVTLSLKGQRAPAQLLVAKNSTAAWLYKTLDKKEQAQEWSNLDVFGMNISYVRTLISRYNHISAVKWKTTQPRVGRIIVFKDPVQPPEITPEPQNETDTLL